MLFFTYSLKNNKGYIPTYLLYSIANCKTKIGQLYCIRIQSEITKAKQKINTFFIFPVHWIHNFFHTHFYRIPTLKRNNSNVHFIEFLLKFLHKYRTVA